MITESMLREAAARSCEIYVAHLEQGYEPENQHVFSVEFEKKLKRLKRKADHPVLYRAMHRVASIILTILIVGGTWLTVDAEARAAFFGWAKEIYETFFVYVFDGKSSGVIGNIGCRPTWIPEGYEKAKETEDNGRINIIYRNEAGQLLRFHCIFEPDETEFFVDAKGGRVTPTIVGGYEADLILFEYPSVANNILWTDKENRAFYISGDLDEDDLIKMANSIYK